jgi:putative oxidoreductase
MRAFIPSRLAEVVFALIFVYFGYLHLANADSMGAYVPSFMPGAGKIWIYITGGAMILAAIAIITGIQKTLAAYLLAAMLLIFAFAIHLKNFNTDASGFLKDTGLAMGAILIGNRRTTA